jgi:hypothetical protein
MGTMTSLFQKPKMNVPGMAGAGTFTTFSQKKPMSKWNKGLKKSSTSSTYAYNGSSSNSWANAVQAVQNIAEAFTASNINACINTIFPTARNDQTKKIVLESCQAIIYFTNQSTAAVAFDIYDCVPRRDMPINSTVEGYTNDPINLWSLGMADQGVPSNVPQVVGITPFQSPAMCENWLIKKVSKIILPQGGTHEHRVHLEPNKAFNLATIRDGDNWFKGLSYNSFFVARGFPVDGTSIGGVANTVTTSGGKIDFVVSYKYTFMSVSDAESNVSIANNLLTVTGAQMVNIGSGVVAAPVNA